MTDILSPDMPDVSSPRRRGGGAGGTGGASGSPARDAQTHSGTSAPRTNQASHEVLGSQIACHTPFQIGAGGLVVIVMPAQLKAACAKRGWSLTDLARRAGISYPTLKSTLRGRPVRPRTAWKVAKALREGSTFVELDGLVGAE